jgi:superfamily II DNA/RNA helicase
VRDRIVVFYVALTIDRRHQDLLKGLYDLGFSKPSKIQERALPLLLSNPWVHQLV